ncbi:MAG TPA: 30S ribosomal protein S12 methylthiotransferase RimO [Chloroflexi bacterium]|jgi:ribosomal protein S12 methylthiotransferase|nr:30S ribosomal protein S12 methylthiotransferase RimO [Chloroflexota bacterium]
MRFYLVTLGCPKNTVDSEMMAELLRRAGHTPVETARRADVIIVNTCGFIEAARAESYGELRALAARKRRGQRLVAMGCLAQRYGDAVRRHVPQVDAVLGTQAWPEIVALVERLHDVEPPAPILSSRPDALVTSISRRSAVGPSAYIKIADGCDASCAFCAIPLIKGRQRSKPAADIVREARELTARGVREAVLIAQDTTAYGRDRGERDALPGLMRAILAGAPELAWLRVLYAYPQNVTPALIEVLAEEERVCRYLDLPLQHAHPDVLRRMRRPHDIAQVYALIARLREAMPDVALRSTFIVGFPGETEAEFEALLTFLEEMALDHVGVFAYSPEEGTAAAQLPDQVPAEVTAERYDRAMRLQQGISRARNEAQVGRTVDVLIEGVGEGLSVGRSYREAPEIDGLVLVPGEATEGAMLRARVVAAQEYDLIAERVQSNRGR